MHFYPKIVQIRRVKKKTKHPLFSALFTLNRLFYAEIYVFCNNRRIILYILSYSYFFFNLVDLFMVSIKKKSVHTCVEGILFIV